MALRSARWVVAVVAAALLWTSGPPASACPFCTSQGQTLSGEVSQANLIVFGRMVNAKQDPKEFGKGTTDLVIELVVKDHPVLNGRKQITLPRYIPPDPKNQTKYLVFCEVFKDNIDPYRGVAVNADSHIGEYLKGALAVRDKDVATRLNYFFKYLDSADPDVANDAYMEFGNADYKEYKALAEKLPAETVVKWLQDPNTPASRFGLYGSMLGHCGKPEHAVVLRSMLEDPKKRFSSGMDGMLAGYVMLSPKEGWQYIRSILADGKKEFLTRYAALRAVRFFYEMRPDVVDKKELVDAISLLLEQPDIADLPIDDLRRWGRWEKTDKVLSLYGRESHNVPIVKRAVIRFALCAPKDNKPAAALVAKGRAADPERVRDIEELLKYENTPKPPTKPSAKK